MSVGYRYLWVIAAYADLLIDQAVEGIYAWFPGYGPRTDNLAAIGATRGLIQGEAETAAHFALRLQNWLTTWTNAGSSSVLAEQIQSYLGNTPVVRIVTRAGLFVTRASNGTTTQATDPTWNWDSVSNPERAGWWSDLWIIVYPSEWATYANTSDPNYVNAFVNGWGIGHEAGRVAVDAILRLVAIWKGAHSYVVAIVFSTDPALFVPGSLGTAGNPDGNWGHWSKNVNGIQVPARTTATAGGTVRYWEPTGGGS